MTSTITLYFNCLVEKEKNFILDNNAVKAIETYLQTLTSRTINNFQYVKQSLSLSIKIDASQAGLCMGEDCDDLNYVKIQNGEQNPFYYFIISKNWKSQSTIELVLSMDTLNTFQYDSDYEVSDKTLVKRMHKDRFDVLSGFYSKKVECTSNTPVVVQFTSTDFATSAFSDVQYEIDLEPYTDASLTTPLIDGIRYIRLYFIPRTSGTATIFFTCKIDAIKNLIDLKSEEIIAPVYKKRYGTERILNNSKSLIEWTLYYKNKDNQDNSPIECYLVTDIPVYMKTPASDRYIDVSDITDGHYIFIAPIYNENTSFDIDGRIVTLESEMIMETYDYYYIHTCIAFRNDNNQLKVYILKYLQDLNSQRIDILSSEEVDNATVKYLGSLDVLDGYDTTSIPSVFNSGFPNPNFTFSFNPAARVQLATKDSIDRTLAENVKLINLPYAPSNFEFDASDNIKITPEWTYVSASKMLRLTDLNYRFKSNIKTDYISFINTFITNVHNVVNLWQDFNRRDWDPKVYHSDFYRPKFVYDSFTKTFALEQIDYANSSHDPFFEFSFIMSRNIVSKFLFTFNTITWNNSKEDYENILAVARNNEEVLYNSQYLNYIRSGYNYDLKAKERTEAAAGIGIGLNVAGLLASIGIGVATGNPLAVAGVVGTSIGLAGQLVSYAKNTAQNEENIQKKLQESKMQSVSVLNADDSDLLYAYTYNKAKMCIYEVSDQMKRVLNDLFHYCGYMINEQMKPEVNTRRSFNFVQASLVVDHTNNLTNEIMDDIKEKFEQGVTFLHYSFNKFDFKQDKENIERDIAAAFEPEE